MFFDEKNGTSGLYKEIQSDKNLGDWKEWINALWDKYENFAPKGFKVQVSNCKDEEFESRIWEMLLANRVIENGFELEKNDSDFRPDICVKNKDSKVWFECYLPTPGDDNNLLTENSVVNKDENIACCTSAIRKKCSPEKIKGKETQYFNWLSSEKFVKENETFILAINGKNLRRLAGNFDVISIAYSLVKEQYNFTDTMDLISTGFEYQPKIFKRNDKKRVIDKCFCDNKYSHLSGILYAKDWGPAPNNARPSYTYLPNLFAKNDLELDISSFFSVITRDDLLSIKEIRDSI